MHIETVNIDITLEAPRSSNGAEDFIKSFLLDFRRDAQEARKAATNALKPPRIGEVWEGQGGIYVGLSRGEDGAADAHLILHVAEAEERLDWEDALAWAQSIEVDGGHKDFHVPSRFESALLYANVRDLMDTSAWYWTSTQYAGDSGYAWSQGFGLGNQSSYDKSYEARVRAVRRLTI